jgi:MinD-like ATPase involved in chromosome partitioning or flagellar assembly
VIIIDPADQGIYYQEMISKLRKDRRLNRTKIFAFSSLKEPEEIQKALNLEFDEYLAKEGHALVKLIELANQAGKAARTQPAPTSHSAESQTDKPISKPDLPKGEGKLIVFLSSKGGIGTSSLCTNIAHITNQNEEYDISVVDLVLPIGSIEEIVGTHDSVNIIETSQKASAEAIIDYLRGSLVSPPDWKFKFLAGSRNPEESEKLDITRIPVILETLKRISDYVFVDFGKSLSKISMPVILAADQIVLTLSLDKTTVEQTKSVWKFLQKKGVKKDQIYFLINRAVSLEGLNKSEVEEILDTTIQLAVPYMGRNFTLANNLNQPIADKFPQDAVTISLRQASDEMLRRIEKRDQKIMF